MNFKVLKIQRARSTINFMIVNFKTQEAYNIYFQFSFKDPWLVPKYEPDFSGAKIPLWGWLFFYFGRQTKGIVIKADSEERVKIRDNKGIGYYLYTIEDREVQKMVRYAVKCKIFNLKIEDRDGEKIIIAEEK